MNWVGDWIMYMLCAWMYNLNDDMMMWLMRTWERILGNDLVFMSSCVEVSSQLIYVHSCIHESLEQMSIMTIN
jgi:hypothetical protein